MKDPLKDILSGPAKPVDSEQLIAYLNQQLSPQQAQELEEQLAAGTFEQEALEGLEKVQDKSTLDTIAASLRKDLKKKIKQRRKKRLPLLPAPASLIYIVLLILLLLMVLAYWIISRTLSQG